MSSLYRPLTPGTPLHTPQGSVGSLRSRTPGQLSLHEYRRQQANTTPISEDGDHKLKKKAAAFDLHHGPQGIPTAPPTPVESSDDGLNDKAMGGKEPDNALLNAAADDLDDDAIIDANILRYTVGRAKKRDVRRQESATSSTSLPFGHHRNFSSSSTSGLLLFSNLFDVNPRPQSAKSRKRVVAISSRLTTSPQVSSPQLKHKPKLPQIPDATQSLDPTPAASEQSIVKPDDIPRTTHTQTSVSHCQPAFGPNMISSRHSQAVSFKSIKRLPRPTQPPIEPNLTVPSFSEDDLDRPLTVLSHHSPFVLSNYQFPEVPMHKQVPLTKTRSYDDAKNMRDSSVSIANLSFTDLLHLYGAGRDRLSQNDSFKVGQASQTQSQKSIESLRAIFEPKRALPKMTSFANDPFDSRPLSTGPPELDDRDGPLGLNRESMYTENWDSRSIIDADENLPPGRAFGIVDYTDLQPRSSLHDSYTPINSIFDQYGRVSTDNAILSRATRTAGRPPASPPPPVPPLVIPKLSLPSEESTEEHTTDYGITRDLLRDHGDTPYTVELPRSEQVRLNPAHESPQEGSSVYDTSASPMPPARADPETLSIALSTLSDEWQTIADTSTHELSGRFSSMADYSFTPFPTHAMPPLHTNLQRRTIIYDDLPEVPSPQSTLPELEAFPERHANAAADQSAPLSDHSNDDKSVPDTPDHHDPSPMRYSLHDGADTIDAFPDSPHVVDKPLVLQEGPTTYHGRSATYDCEPSSILVTRNDGLVDINFLSPEPHDEIDLNEHATAVVPKRNTTLSSMFRGRGSKRSSRNFSNQRNLIELQMPKRTSSLGATKLTKKPPQHRTTQIEGGEIHSVASSEQSSIQAEKTFNFGRSQARETEEIASRSQGQQVMSGAIAADFQRSANVRTRPASIATSNEPLIYEGDQHAIAARDSTFPWQKQENGGLRQFYLAEEGAYTNASHGAQDFYPNLALNDEGYDQQLARSRLCFAIFLPLPFMLLLYSCGAVDRLAGPRGMLKHYKTWALYIGFIEIVMLLIALTIWGVARRGS